MNVYDLIKQQLSAGVDRPSDIEIYDNYPQYSGNVISQALKYAHGITDKPSTTEVIFHSDEVFFPPYGEEEYEAFCHMTGGFHRHYWIDDELCNHIGLADAMDELQRYLNSRVKLPAPIFVCGGL